MGISGRSSFSLSTWVSIVTLLVIVFSGETCNAKEDPKCTPSSCGHIYNISYPFRLKYDAPHCSKALYTLSCENNVTVLDFNVTVLDVPFSGKYFVQEINYQNRTIRVVDPGLDNKNCSSIPRYFSSESYPFDYLGYAVISTNIGFFKCPNPVNSSLFVDPAPCINSQPETTYVYVTVGDVEVGDLGDGCSIYGATLASEQYLADQYGTSFSADSKNYNTASYKYIDIHNALVYGFELQYFLELTSHCEGQWSTNYKCFPHTVAGAFGLAWEAIRSFLYRGDHQIRYGRRFFINIDRRWMILIGLGMLFLVRFIFGTPFVVGILISKWRRRHLSMDSTIEEFLHGDNNFMPIRYDYEAIKKMSNRFKDKLGEGGYGSVFKGKLRSGRFGAIKMLSKPKANGQDFMSEVATIGRIHHVNVVQLIGYCVEGSKRALVYDFMPNGSLDKYIYTKEESIPLSYKKMYEISVGVAQGIEYLHEGCDMQILHFDIKPHNILLDENFIPKISDFGLAKLYPTDNSIVSLTAARGTMGYMAPELFYKNIGGVSYKADVYSFGMLLMEMASKRKNLNALAEHSSQIYFPSWVYDQYNEGNNLEMGDGTEEERKIVKKMVITALWCIQLKPSDRPSMNKVIEMLEGDVNSLEMPPKPYFCPQEIPVCDVQDNLNPACSNVELTYTLSAR